MSTLPTVKLNEVDLKTYEDLQLTDEISGTDYQPDGVTVNGTMRVSIGDLLRKGIVILDAPLATVNTANTVSVAGPLFGKTSDDQLVVKFSETSGVDGWTAVGLQAALDAIQTDVDGKQDLSAGNKTARTLHKALFKVLADQYGYKSTIESIASTDRRALLLIWGDSVVWDSASLLLKSWVDLNPNQIWYDYVTGSDGFDDGNVLNRVTLSCLILPTHLRSKWSVTTGSIYNKNAPLINPEWEANPLGGALGLMNGDSLILLSAVGGAQKSTNYKVFYQGRANGGDFIIQSSTDNATWTDELTVDTSLTTGTQAAEVTKTVGEYFWRVTSNDQNDESWILGHDCYDTTSAEIHALHMGGSNQEIGNYLFPDGATTRSTLWQAISPDGIFIHFADDDSVISGIAPNGQYTDTLPQLVADLNNANLSPLPSVILTTPTFNLTGADLDLKKTLDDFAQNNNWAHASIIDSSWGGESWDTDNNFWDGNYHPYDSFNHGALAPFINKSGLNLPFYKKLKSTIPDPLGGWRSTGNAEESFLGISGTDGVGEISGKTEVWIGMFKTNLDDLDNWSIVSRGGQGASSGGWAFVVSSSGAFQVYTYNDSGALSYYIWNSAGGTADQYADGQWHIYELTLNFDIPGSEVVTLTLDGVPIAITDEQPGTGTYSDGVGGINNRGEHINVGANAAGGNILAVDYGPLMVLDTQLSNDERILILKGSQFWGQVDDSKIKAIWMFEDGNGYTAINGKDTTSLIYAKSRTNNTPDWLGKAKGSGIVIINNYDLTGNGGSDLYYRTPGRPATERAAVIPAGAIITRATITNNHDSAAYTIAFPNISDGANNYALGSPVASLAAGARAVFNNPSVTYGDEIYLWFNQSASSGGSDVTVTLEWLMP